MNGAKVSSTVGFAGGNFHHATPLFRAQGIGPQVEFTLDYNSRDLSANPIGPGWTHTYLARIVRNPDDTRLLVEGNGRRILFRPTATSGMYAPQSNFGRPGTTLQQFSDGTFLLTETNGLKYSFRNDGMLREIRDRNGLALTMGYSGSNLVTITDAAGRVTSLSYDFQSRLEQVTDPAGHVATLTRDLLGNLERVVDPEGRRTSFTYESGRMVSMTGPGGGTTTYTYDERGWMTGATDPSGIPIRVFHEPGNLRSTVLARNGGMTTTSYDFLLDAPLQVIGADNGITSYTYDANRNVTSVTNPAGDNTSYTYDANGNRTGETDALGRTTTYTYNAFGQTTSVTDPEGHVTTYGYDDRGNPTSVTDATGAVTTHAYDAQGKKTSMTAPGGKTTTYGYDERGNLASVTDPAGMTTTFAYDLLGNRTSVTDPNNATTTYVYDNISRLVRVIDPEGHAVSYTYDPEGNPASETDAMGNVTRFEYNEQKQLARKIDPLGHVTTYDYTYGGCSSCGGGGDLLASVTDPLENTARFEYDIAGRRTRETDSAGVSTSLEYDVRGNLVRRTDPNGRTTQYVHDPLSRMIAQADPKGGVTAFDLTPADLTDNVVDAAGNRTHYAYDNVGRLVRTESPDTGTTTYTYNGDGTLATRTDANGTVIAYAYDNASRLTHIAYPDPAQDVTFSYDATTSSHGKGRLTGMIDLSGSTVYHYDALGRVVREEKSILGVNYTMGHAYDNVGNLSSVTYPGGRTVSYAHDALRRPTSVTATVNGASTVLAGDFAYDNASRLQGYTLGNGLPVSYSHDAVGRPVAIGTPGVTSLSYVIDPAGQIVSWVDLLHPDPVIASDNGGLTTYAYRGNRLDNVTVNGVTRTHAYDNTGNTISDGLRTFVYNRNQRLIQVFDQGIRKGEYVYDGKERRVLKTAGGVTTVYHYDLSDRLIAETDAAGHLRVDYVYRGAQPLAQVRKPGRSEAAYYYHLDHLGTPKVMTDAARNVVWRVDTDPFGNEAGTPLKTVENNLRFPGQYYDAETGLHYNFHRDYDPKTGRYVEADPVGIGKAASINNIYAYVDGSPMLYKDILGLEKLIWFDKSEWPYYEAAVKYNEELGILRVFSHGSSEGVNGMRVVQLANAIRPYWRPGMPIVLDSCNSAKGDNPIAKQLAQELRVKVIGASTSVWILNPFTLEEKLYEEATNIFGTPLNYPDTSKPGQWITFYPTCNK